jgi:hypothetical protein
MRIIEPRMIRHLLRKQLIDCAHHDSINTQYFRWLSTIPSSRFLLPWLKMTIPDLNEILPMMNAEH